MSKNALLIMTFAWCSILSVSSQTALTLEEAKQYAIEHHLSVQNAQYDIEQAVLQKKETRGIGLPQADISGSFNYFFNLPVQVVDASFINPNAQPGETISFKAGTDYSSTGTLQVNQLLFNGSYIVGLQVAALYVDFQKTFENQTKEDVVFQVIRAYQMLAVAEDNLAFLDSMVQTTERLVQQQEKYLELGMLKAEALDQMNFTMSQVRNAKRQAILQRDNAKVMLKLAMNFPFDQPLTIAESSEDLMSKSNITTNNSVMNNVQVQILQQQMLLNEYQLKNYKYERLPSLNSFFQQSYNAFRNDFNFFEDRPWFSQTLVGLQLQVPILSGGQRHFKIQRQKVELLKNANDLEQLKLGLKAQEVQYQNNLAGAIDRYDLQNQNMELAQKIYNNAVKKKELGVATELEVTQKYNQLVQAQSELMSAKIDVLEAKLALEKLYNKLLNSNNN